MRYEFTCVGVTPLLHHKDDVEAAEAVKEWQQKNKNQSIPGDDRSPPWKWKTVLHSDGETICVPADALFRALINAGAKITIKGKETLKRAIPGGLSVTPLHLPILVHGKPIDVPKVEAIDGTFAEQAAACKVLGFRLHVKRLQVGKSKHVRVRPCFDQWEIRGTLESYADDIMTKERLQTLGEIAGTRFGLLDSRPGSPMSPGPYGQFTWKIKAVK